MAVYDDRVEVTSPGMLFDSLKIEDIREGISIPRNRLLVYAFTYITLWSIGVVEFRGLSDAVKKRDLESLSYQR